MKLITALLIGLFAGPAFAQVAIPPAQPSDVTASTPLFRVTVVGRTTAAINYRPRSGETRVDLVGTALLPEARGYADVSGERVTSRSTRASERCNQRPALDPNI